MKRFSIILFIFILFLSYSCSNKNEVIATFDKGEILQKELDLVLEKYPAEKRKEILSSSRKIKPVLESIAMKKIAFLYAKQTNIINISILSNQVFNDNKNDLINYMFEQEIQPKKGKAKGSDIKKYSTQLKIKLIWLRVSEWMNKEELKTVKKKAKKILKLYKSGTDFSTLANRYSDDPQNFKNGNLGIITTDKFELSLLKAIMKVKEGEHTPVIESPLGFHIFKLHKITSKNPVKLAVSHILIKTNNNGKKQIESILKLLNQGESFEFLANQYTQDQSNFRNGDVPPFRFNRIYYDLAQTAYKTKPGKISNIIQNRYGIFIIKTEEKTPQKDNLLEKLKNNKRYIQGIEMAKTRYDKDQQEYSLRQKIRNNYDIEYNISYFTNKNIKPDTVILSVPEIDFKVTHKECTSILSSKDGPVVQSDLTAKMDKIYNQLVYPELTYQYAKAKGYYKEDRFQVKLWKKFYEQVYQSLKSTLKFDFTFSEKEYRKHYKIHEKRYYITKVIDKRPTRVKQSYQEAKDNIKRDLENTKRSIAIKEWEQSILKKYNFTILFSKLGLAKDTYYYVKLGDQAYENKKYKKALKYYQKAIAKDKDYTDAYLKTIMTYDQLNKKNEIIKTFDQLQKIKNMDIKVILKYMDTDNHRIKIKLIEMIGLTGNNIAQDKLIELYHNETSIKTVQAVVRSLGLIRSQKAYNYIYNDLKNFNKKFNKFKDNDKEILKWYLIEAIGYIGNKEAVPYLTGLINKSKDLNLKCFIIEALGRIKDNRSAPVLERLLKDKVWGVRVLAAESLKNITGKTYKVDEIKKGAVQ